MQIPRHYSLVKDHEHHFEIHDSRDNTRLKIAKKPLHPAHQIKIMKMQPFAEGGEVDDENEGLFNRMGDNRADEIGPIFAESPDVAKQEASQEAQRQNTRDVFGLDSNAPTDTAPPPEPLMPDVQPMEQIQGQPAPTPQVQPQTMPQQAMPPPEQPGAPTLAGLQKTQGQYSAGINQQAQGKIAQNKQIADLYDENKSPEYKTMMDFQRVTQQRLMAAQDQLDALSKGISDTTIDPKRYWNSKDTGSKISTVLGVMLSGAGAGASGSTRNMAMEQLNGAIDKDIQSQRDNLGKKQSLLSDNLKIQGSLIQAENATRLQYEAILQGKMAKLAAQSGDPMILGQAQQQIAESKMRMLPLQMELAKHEAQQNMMRQAMQQAAGSGEDTSGIDHNKFKQLRAAGMIPKEDEAAIIKESNSLAEGRSLRTYYHRTFNELNNKMLAGNLTPGQRDSAIWTIAGKLQHAAAGRFNLDDAKKQAMAMYPNMGDLPSTSAAKVRNSEGLFDTLEAGTTTLDRYGLKKPYQTPHAHEGKIATNARGDKLIMQDGKWVPYK